MNQDLLTKSYILEGKWNKFVIEKCPNCQFDWYVRFFYLGDNNDEIFPEYNGITSTIERNQILKKYYKVIKCIKCKKEFTRTYDYSDEKSIMIQAISEDKKVYNEYMKLKNIAPVIVNKVMKEDEITDDALQDIIDKTQSDMSKGQNL